MRFCKWAVLLAAIIVLALLLFRPFRNPLAGTWLSATPGDAPLTFAYNGTVMDKHGLWRWSITSARSALDGGRLGTLVLVPLRPGSPGRSEVRWALSPDGRCMRLTDARGSHDYVRH